jgi:hypothetical protein
MKNRDFNAFPSVEELYALEQAARVARSRAMGELFRRAVAALRRAFEENAPKGLRHA